MPFCKNCGKELDEKAKFCPNCGAPNEFTPSPADAAFKTVKRDGGPYGAYRLEDLPEGFVIDDRYEVKAKVGQGGFGAVYRVYDRSLSVDKAIKIIPDGIAGDREAMSALKQEARILISLTHDSIVRVYDVHDSGSIKYIDMEYVDGRPLNELKIDGKGGVLPEREVRLLAVKIAEALAYAHGKGVIHKDIKPQNVMVTDGRDVKILDFGISESVRTSMSRLANSSSSGTLVYMAPEQVKGKDVGPEADIYSFGAMLYELLSGHPPFWKGAIEYQILNEHPDTIAGVSGEMNFLVLKCLEKDYRDRFRSFDEVESGLNGKKMHHPSPIDDIAASTAMEKEEFNRFQEAIDKPEMVPVEGGTFRMGSTGGYDDEEPVQSVTVSSFYLSKYEVTQGLWKEVMGDNPSDTGYGIGNSSPVNNVSWYDAVRFCNKLSERDGLDPAYRISGTDVRCDWSKNGYRLPTEAEWEYAARGGNKSRGYTYAGSNSIGDVAWYHTNSGGNTHPVGRKRANELGLYDMSGNVWEWCWDWYGEYGIDSQRDPRGASSGQRRVNRGGSWRSASSCRTAYRNYDDPSLRYCLGFRLARSAVQ